MTRRSRSLLSAAAQQHLQVSFTPYGYRPGSDPTLLGFMGQRFDRASGSYPLGNGYRYFVPSLMRFSSTDELSPFAEGGLNAYGYCLGDPVNLRDPSGNFPLPLLGRKPAPTLLKPGTKGFTVKSNGLPLVSVAKQARFSVDRGLQVPLQGIVDNLHSSTVTIHRKGVRWFHAWGDTPGVIAQGFAPAAEESLISLSIGHGAVLRNARPTWAGVEVDLPWSLVFRELSLSINIASIRRPEPGNGLPELAPYSTPL